MEYSLSVQIWCGKSSAAPVNLLRRNLGEDLVSLLLSGGFLSRNSSKFVKLDPEKEELIIDGIFLLVVTFYFVKLCLDWFRLVDTLPDVCSLQNFYCCMVCKFQSMKFFYYDYLHLKPWTCKTVVVILYQYLRL